MGKPEREAELFETYASQGGLVRDIASLVIAYNMVRRNNMTNLCIDLQNHIKQTLRLKGYESNLKIYGSGVEDAKTEYKTSIVFPPDEGMRANMPYQIRSILRVVASMAHSLPAREGRGDTSTSSSSAQAYQGSNVPYAAVSQHPDISSPYARASARW